MANQWHFKVMELLFKWMFSVVPLFLQATSTGLKLMTVSYQRLYLTSEDLLNSVIELEPAIFIILSVPLQSAVAFFQSRRQYVQRGNITDLFPALPMTSAC